MTPSIELKSSLDNNAESRTSTTKNKVKYLKLFSQIFGIFKKKSSWVSVVRELVHETLGHHHRAK